MRLAGISTITDANKFLATYITKHNQRFAVAAREKTNLHRSLDGINLREVLCQKEERVLNNDQTIQYKTSWFLLAGKQKTILRPKDKITVTEYLDGEIGLSIRAVTLVFTELPARPIKEPKSFVVRQAKQPWIPPVGHPWRQYQNQQKVTFLNS